jgi:hypothetical protein
MGVAQIGGCGGRFKGSDRGALVAQIKGLWGSDGGMWWLRLRDVVAKLRGCNGSDSYRNSK